MKKICFIGPANSDHIKKWCYWFVHRNFEVHVVSLVNHSIDGVFVHYLGESASPKDTDFEKLKYLNKIFLLRKIVKSIHPDIISVHYASSYGTLVALSGLRDYNLSVWGSDVYDFPKKSLLHKFLTIISLNRAAKLLSTSSCMSDEAGKYTKKPFFITPFGVDTELFHPILISKNTISHNQEIDTKDGVSFIIGTVKTLEEKYGIKFLILAVALLRKRYPFIPVKLRIAGKGSKEKEYKALATSLGLDDCLTWLGFISQQDAAKEWAGMDVAVVYSESESFGVSAVEAQACATPVIVSNIPGLMESTCPRVTSVVVQRGCPEKLCEAIYQMWLHPQKRKNMGDAGRKFVQEKFELKKTFERIEKVLTSV